ncbi:LuxR C-terminal-related transcriptional regulator [Petroclostridium sp. X23]|uniref:LuxR C-terminal-related transcriptional regulator n=1 Tax=Petroclostridium sp. X23 TaxID=3045146 RepID=UPI0024AD0414|nr:LuxR C-terminal-related transcriptional regulator [Petroclostridium sp. X23]WHH60958.1 LuxR C-terminal-related transcriptional regulator [Petroclostridium sp. X23]
MKNTKLLARARINTILSAVYEYPLTILEAPMGYGKTTAVKKFIESENLKPFWFTFPDFKNSEVVFWNKFTDEIIKIEAQAGLALKSLGLPDDAPQMEKVLLTLADISFGEKFLMVLDDYHLSSDIRLNKLILRLAQEELDHLHILLITRDTTDIDFVELLSRGLCCIISRHHLKFTDFEIEDYCRMMHEGISDADLRRICEYTDGWISFIYIILLGLESGIPVGMSITMEELVEKALFSSYDKQTQDFLLKLSIMEIFTANQAEFVTRNENAKLILKKLNRENAFVFFDEKSSTYKIHSVLLDYLRLRQNFSIEESCELYGRLGDWYLKKQEFQTAYGYLNRAGQTERILSHLNIPENIRDVLIKFEGADEMFDSTPRDILFKYPLAYLLYIFHSIIQGKQNTILGWTERLDELQQYYEKQDDIDEPYRNRILGEILIVRKFTDFNHLPKMIASDKEIIKLLNGQNSYIALRKYVFTLGSPQYLYIYFRNAGSFKDLSDMLAEYVGFTEFSNGCGTGCDSLSLAEYALETGDFDTVETNSLLAIQKAETMSQISIIVCAKFCLIRLRIVQGRLAEAIELLSQLQLDMDKINRPLYNTAVDLCKGYIFASICHPKRIPSWLQIGDMTVANFYYQGIAYSYLVYGKAVMASKKYAKLEVLTRQFKKYFSLYNNRLGFIHNQIFEAVAKCNLYGIDTGTAVLEAALNEAWADRLIMPFVESAPHIIVMLQSIVQSNTNNKYVNHILTLCRKYEQTVQGLSSLPVHLSQREINILSLAAEGLSRKEIAAQLCISDETAKTHLKNVYQKLGVSSKILAVKVARDRGYLEMADMYPFI